MIILSSVCFFMIVLLHLLFSSLFFAALFYPSPLSSLVLSSYMSLFLLLFLFLSFVFSFLSLYSFYVFFLCLLSPCVGVSSCVSSCVVWCMHGDVLNLYTEAFWVYTRVVVASSVCQKITHVGLSLGPTSSPKVTTGCCPLKVWEKVENNMFPIPPIIRFT